MHIINHKSDLTPKASVESGAYSGIGHSRLPNKVKGRVSDYRRSQNGMAVCKCHINF